MAETDTAEMAGQLAEWRGRGGGKAAQEERRGPAKVIQLPLWPEPKRGAPNVALRSALFAAVHKEWRYMERELLAAQGGIHNPVYRAAAEPIGPRRVGTGPAPWPGRRPSAHSVGSPPTPFSRPSAARTAKRIMNGWRCRWPVDCHRRGDFGWSAHIRGEPFGVLPRRGHGQYRARRSIPSSRQFYGPQEWTQLDWEQRLLLRGKPLALWLHGFYASHASPYPLTVTYLHKLSGSQTKQLRYFKKNLKQALEELAAVGAIQAFEIRGELVHVRTVPSRSQQRHLAVRRPPPRRRNRHVVVV